MKNLLNHSIRYSDLRLLWLRFIGWTPRIVWETKVYENQMADNFSFGVKWEAITVQLRLTWTLNACFASFCVPFENNRVCSSWIPWHTWKYFGNSLKPWNLCKNSSKGAQCYDGRGSMWSMFCLPCSTTEQFLSKSTKNLILSKNQCSIRTI